MKSIICDKCKKEIKYKPVKSVDLHPDFLLKITNEFSYLDFNIVLHHDYSPKKGAPPVHFKNINGVNREYCLECSIKLFQEIKAVLNMDGVK